MMNSQLAKMIFETIQQVWYIEVEEGKKTKKKSKSAETCIVMLDQKKTFIPLCIIVTIYLSYFQTRKKNSLFCETYSPFFF